MTFRSIDIHTHTNFAAFDHDREEVIRRALDEGVAMINVGTQKDTSRKAVEIAEKHPEGVYAIVGVHPIHTSKSFHDEKELGKIPPAAPTTPSPTFSEKVGDTPSLAGGVGSAPFKKGRIGSNGFTSRGEVFEYEYYKKLATHPKVVGIGECGLDYYRTEHGTWSTGHGTWSMEHKRQEEAFRKQIELAIEVKKPLMLHLRNGSGRSAYNDAFSFLKSYLINHKSGSSLRGNLHFFAGSTAEAKPFLDAGFYFSFTGVITFAKEYADIIRYLPLNRLMSETDAPYVAPEPHRGKRNEPLYVTEVVKAIARIKGEDEEKVRLQFLKNAEHLFGIPLPL